MRDMSNKSTKAAFGGMRGTKGRGPFTLQYIASGLYGEPTWLLVDKANKVVAKEHNEQSAKEMLRKANAGEPVYVSARPGAKAKMAYGVADAAPKFTKGETVADAVHPNRKGKVVEVIPGSYDAKSYTKAENQYIVSFMPKGGLVRYGEQRLVRASRPGAKVMMAATPHKITLKDKSGVTQTWMVSDKILRDMNGTKRYAEATGAKPDYSSVLRLGVRMGEAVLASRPGAKARFSNGDKNRRLMQVLADADRRIANQVVSNIAKHYGITTQQVFNEIFDAEAEDLMDYVTEPVRSAAYVILQKKGMMSRPGAKAKMAIRSDSDVFDVMTEASDKGLDRHNLVREARRLRDAIDPHGVGGQAMLKHKSWPQLVRLAEQIERLPAAYARPGAKATAAKPAETPAMRELGRKMQELTQKADRLLRQSLSASVTSEQSQQMQDEVERISEQLDAMGEDLARQRKAAGFEKPSDLEREDVKAGLKLMEKADKAVSDKIRTLIAEGKPQDQAVAIALDMKRRGEL